MSYLLVILIGTVLVNTFLLMQNDQSLGGTRHTGSIANAMRIGGATSVVLVVASIATSGMWRIVNALPADTLLFFYAMNVVACAVTLDLLTRRRLQRLARALATSPVLTISNSLALGTGMMSPIDAGIGAALLYASGLAVSFTVAATLFVALSARVTIPEVPTPFRITPITLVTAGLFTLALMGFTGLLRG